MCLDTFHQGPLLPTHRTMRAIKLHSVQLRRISLQLAPTKTKEVEDMDMATTPTSGPSSMQAQLHANHHGRRPFWGLYSTPSTTGKRTTCASHRRVERLEKHGRMIVCPSLVVVTVCLLLGLGSPPQLTAASSHLPFIPSTYFSSFHFSISPGPDFLQLD